MVDRTKSREGQYMRLIALIAVLFLLSCAGVSEQQKQTADSQFQVNLHRCDTIWQEYRTGVSGYIDVVYCMNQASTEYFKAVDFPYPEVIPLANSYNLVLADRVDAGELTPEQAFHIGSLFLHELVTQAIQQDRAAMEQQLAWRDLLRSLNNYYIPNHPITCIQTGNVFTCN